MFAAQMEQNPMMMEQLKAMQSAQLENLKQMKDKGMPEEMLKELEKNLREQNLYNDKLKHWVKSASQADIQFIKDNMTWLMSIMPQQE